MGIELILIILIVLLVAFLISGPIRGVPMGGGNWLWILVVVLIVFLLVRLLGGDGGT